ncbi:hypothetical protein [Castellaniella sp. GW247-6E4]|uniref:hypothetical protein n=1 Tax=Castellaniella sp. GW247-6E4 TaxID=3140380 RepID=UPI0033154E1D
MALFEKINVLLLWDDVGKVASTVRANIDALARESRFKVFPMSVFGDIPGDLNIDKFDVVVIHYSLVLSVDAYVSAEFRRRLKNATAIKAVFIQDEYRFVDRSIAAMRDIGIDLLFTCVPEEEIPKVYPESSLPGVEKVNVLTGYVEDALLERILPSYQERRIDIGYRARKVPAWLGELGQEKWDIGQRVGEDAARYGLAVDLAYREEERLYGKDWISFLLNCKATLGVESGASVFDFSGDIQAVVEKAALDHPEWSFRDLQRKYFLDYEGIIRLNQISPRCFEAAALKTLMILYEGRYSDRMTPWRHYLPLKKDHSNFAEIVAILRNESKVNDIVDNAYREVALNPDNSFAALVRIFDEAILRRLGSDYVPITDVYSTEAFSSIASQHREARIKANRFRALMAWGYFFFFGKILGFASESFRDKVQVLLGKYLRPIFRKLLGR